MQTRNLPIEAEENVGGSSRFILFNLFRRDYQHYDGVARINIYLLRLVYTLVFLFVGYDSWAHIIDHTGPWENVNAAAWCMWGTYSVLSFIGIFRPLKMLPLVIFEIIYKIAWLFIVAWPLWIKNELIGSPAEEMTRTFIWVILPIVAVPWRYFFRTHILGKRWV